MNVRSMAIPCARSIHFYTRANGQTIELTDDLSQRVSCLLRVCRYSDVIDLVAIFADPMTRKHFINVENPWQRLHARRRVYGVNSKLYNMKGKSGVKDIYMYI